jgi:hypothetical protein
MDMLEKKPQPPVKHGVYNPDSGAPPPQDIDGGSVKPAPKASKPKKMAKGGITGDGPRGGMIGKLLGSSGGSSSGSGSKYSYDPNTQSYTQTAGMKKGGMTASKRADGIAQRGKTKGRMV